MYRIAICDDDKVFVDYISNLLLKLNVDIAERIYIAKYYSGVEFINDINNKYDLVILDMQMQPIDGLTAAVKLREKDEDTVLVFCTGVQLPQPEFFEVLPFRYLMKSYDEKRLKKELTVILNKMIENKKTHYFYCINDGQAIKVSIDQIMYISNAKRGSILHIYNSKDERKEELKDKEKLGEIYERLKSEHFEYAHNSYIVNMASIITIKGDVILLQDGTELNISRTKKKTFHSSFVKYLGTEYMRESRRK